MKKILLSGNEAIARGAYEAGCHVAAAYPGTPSTEILEAMKNYQEINSRWSSNEKVALEVAGGASMAGARALAAMKHVGVNVAADPLFTLAYIGVLGGLVLVSADDPGCHSSQNEQDNRLYAPMAKVLMLEPSDSQECLDFAKAAFELSERFDTPVLLRVTTRICHSKSPVLLGERLAAPVKTYKRDIRKNAMLPANARERHKVVEEKLLRLAEYSNESPFNTIEYNDLSIGVISSGVSYMYAKEVFDNKASYLKIGLSYPLPEKLIQDFASKVDKIYVVEEGEPYLEKAIKALGIECVGKKYLPLTGELDAALVKKAFGFGNPVCAYESPIPAPLRPPVLCPGCPHRGIFYVLGRKAKNVVVSGDIGCYTLGIQAPLSGLDSCICMGAGFSAAIGMAEALKQAGDTRKVFGVLGDSTFFHSGITGLVDAVNTNANICLCVLDNQITAMTGQQDNPGTGKNLLGDEVQAVDILKIIKATGISEEKIHLVDPLDLKTFEKIVDNAIKTTGLSVVIARRPCILIKKVAKQLEGKIYQVDSKACKKCKMCLKVGCPAINFQKGYAEINQNICVACECCFKVCKFDAISEVQK